MQENNSNDPQTTSPTPEEIIPEPVVETTVESTVVPTVEPTVEVEPLPIESTVVTPVSSGKPPSSARLYVFAAVGVIIIGLGLFFLMQKDGRFATNSDAVVAVVNDTEIRNTDYQNSLNQLKQLATSQGKDITDLTVVADMEKEAIDTLVNSELLRQEALDQDLSVTPEEIEARYTDITTGVGGPEALAERMKEYGISEEILRRDIENELLIQKLFEIEITPNLKPIEDEDVVAFYDQLGGKDAGLPPFEEVKSQVADQLKLNQQNELISKYIEGLRADAKIDVRI